MERKNSFGDTLKRIRQMSEISQETLAGAVGLTASMISKYENNRQFPAKAKAFIIAEALAKLGTTESNLEEIRKSVEGLPGVLDVSQYNHPCVATINQRFDRISNEEAEFKSELLLSLMQVTDQLWEAKNKNINRKWNDVPKIADKAIDLLNETVVSRMINIADEERAHAYHNSGDYRKAIHYYRRLLSDLRENKGDTAAEQGKYLVRLAIDLRRMGDLGEAEKHLLHACELSDENPELLNESQRKLIGIYIQQTKIDNAISMTEAAIKNVSPSDTLMRAKLERHKAWALSFRGDWDTAIELYKSSNSFIEKYYQEKNDKELVIIEQIKSARYLADVFVLRNAWAEEAEKLYRRALDLLGYPKVKDADQVKHKLLLGMNLRGLGKVLVEKEGWEKEAETYLMESERHSRALDEPLAEGIVSIDIGRLYAKRGRLHQAYDKLFSALEQLIHLGNRFYIGECLVAIFEANYQNDSVSSMNIDEKYNVALDLFEKYRSGAIKQNGNMLFDLHYSKLLSYMGLIRIDQGALSNGVDYLCQSTLRGLSYNTYIFQERVGDALVAIKNLVKENRLEDAETVCEKFIEYWKGQKSVTKDKTEDVKEALEIVSTKQDEIGLLLAGHSKGKQK